ncbi:sugar ABC transporter ATP-binding protein [Clostridium sediminicola]|uniref:sugar ABC transporter ATP-binding protein n=1 Tax=Clostridium sediminicola TaxID=3114879 RepID=UPI0031F25137
MNNTKKVVLSVENITKRFLGTVALKNVSLSLYEKEILAVMGENGAGKSTLMKILSGLYPHHEVEGIIKVDGKECKFNKPKDSENSGIAMIYQELNLELDLTVAENICLGAMPKNKFGVVNWSEARELAKKTLARLHVNMDVNVTVRNLSPSMQQLVSIARALVRNPRILILDEPTSVLTEGETQKLMKVLRELVAQGIACLYISHKLDEVFDLCDRMIILRDGYYISEHHKADGYDSKTVIEDMIGRQLDVMYPKMDKVIVDEEVLRVENLKVPHTFAYGKNIIEDVSFHVKRGEILGLTGLVGSGRSETLNAIFGSIPKTDGSIYLEGKEVKIHHPQDSKKVGIGLLTEDRKKNGFIPAMSIKHNMTLTILKRIQRILLLDQKKETKISKQYFDKLRVKAPNMNNIIVSLSGGNQQKVILAKWLMTDLKVLLLDEPTRGIDVGAKAEIYEIINELAKKGISIVIISSEIPELLAICDRFVVLNKGKVQAELSKEEANEVSILQAASDVS